MFVVLQSYIHSKGGKHSYVNRGFGSTLCWNGVGGAVDNKVRAWLTERQIYFNRFGMYLIALSLFFVGYAQASDMREPLAITAQILTPLFALDIVPVSLRLEKLGRELRTELGLPQTALSSLGGIIFTMFWLGFWTYLAHRAGVSPYIYACLFAVGVLIIVGIAIKHVRSVKRGQLARNEQSSES